MKALHVIFQREAQADVEAIARYIAGDNPEAAGRFFGALDDLCELLMRTPGIGSTRIFQSPRLHGTFWKVIANQLDLFYLAIPVPPWREGSFLTGRQVP